MFFCRYIFPSATKDLQKIQMLYAKVRDGNRRKIGQAVTAQVGIEEEGTDMIEIIQQTVKTEENSENKLPKNIRQIGNPEKDFRIYMEDYVYTYLHPAQIHGMEIGILPRLLILVGEINHFSDRSCAFISGAVQVENREDPEGMPELNERTWRRIHKEIQRFFDKCEIVGWVLDIPGNALEVTVEMENMHRRNFVNQFQFFFLMDSREREEAFYTWKEGRLTRKEGYFIYYEKNPQMQEYMISRREELYGDKGPREEVPDQAAKNYRAMMMEKKKRAYKRGTGILSYLSSLLMVVILCSVSVILLKNIRRMDHMEQTISVMSMAIESTEQEKENEENHVAVETVKGNILPVDEGAQAKEELSNQEEAKGKNPAESVPAEDLPSENIPAENVPSENNSSEKETPLENAPADQEAPPATPQEKQAKETENNSGTAPSVGETAENYLKQGYYIVQAGDSLRQICYSIYQNYAMIERICEINGIENQDSIYIGQKIMLPQ